MYELKHLRVVIPALALAACAANSSAVAGSAPTQRADTLAGALAAADLAADSGDAVALKQSLRTIEALGAKPLTDSDKAALGQWKSAAYSDEPPMRGRTLGPAYRSGMVSAGNKAVIQQTFYGGAPANVSLRVAEGSALKLRITDTSDRNVCEKAARKASCRWMPLYTQMHRIELVNDQGENAHYYIVFD